MPSFLQTKFHSCSFKILFSRCSSQITFTIVSKKTLKKWNFHRFMIFSWFFMTFSTSQSSHGFCSWLFHFPHLCIPAARCVATAQGQAPGDASVGSRLWCCCWDRRRNLEKNEASERAWKKAGGSLVMGMARIGRGWFLFFKIYGFFWVISGWICWGFDGDLVGFRDLWGSQQGRLKWMKPIEHKTEVLT